MTLKLSVSDKDERGVVTVRSYVTFYSEVEVDPEDIRTPEDHREKIKAVKNALRGKIYDQLAEIEEECSESQIDSAFESHPLSLLDTPLHREDTFEKWFYKHLGRHGADDNTAFGYSSLKSAYEAGKNPNNFNPE